MRVSKPIKLKDLEDRLIIVKVGDNDRPAQKGDIKDVKKKLKKALKGVKYRALICHHAISVQVL